MFKKSLTMAKQIWAYFTAVTGSSATEYQISDTGGKNILKTEDVKDQALALWKYTALCQWSFLLHLSEHEFWGCLSPVIVPVLVKTTLCALSRNAVLVFSFLLKHWKSSLSTIGSGRFSFWLFCVYEITGLKTRYKTFTQWVYNNMHSVQRIFFPLSKLMLKNPVLEVGWWCTANITSKQGRFSCRTSGQKPCSESRHN